MTRLSVANRTDPLELVLDEAHKVTLSCSAEINVLTPFCTLVLVGITKRELWSVD